MTIESVNVPKTPIFLSEIFPITVDRLNFISFRLTPEIDRELGNRLSWRFCAFSSEFTDLVVIWHEGYFYGLVKPDRPFPTLAQLKNQLEEVRENLKSEIGDRHLGIEEVCQPKIKSLIIAQLAVRILKLRNSFPRKKFWEKNRVEVRREVNFWAETVEIQDNLQPALALTIRSSFVFQGGLDEFYKTHPNQHQPHQLLIGLKVRDHERGSAATIINLAGTIGERRAELMAKATGTISQKSLSEAPYEQPIVSVRFGKDKKVFDYPMAALVPCITEETAHRFNIQYGELLKASKISYLERKDRLAESKTIAQQTLGLYGIQLCDSLNSRQNNQLFIKSSSKPEDVSILFGNNLRTSRSRVLKGLSEGGIYRRHQDYADHTRPIRISVLKVGDFKVKVSLLDEISKRLKRYGFNSLISKTYTVSLAHASIAVDRVNLEREVKTLMEVPTDIVLTFLPQSDRHADSQENGSLYTLISSLLLRRGIASQVIYEQTAIDSSNHSNILNQVVPGILAKLGNLPFILAEPLEIADGFIGLDISRIARKKGSGSQNVCASVRLYGKQGEFLGYRLEDTVTEGEEIDKQTLERFLPDDELSGKTILIYRDGRFCGDEIKNLRERETAIEAQFILVECIKSGNPRLYNFQQSAISAPSKGLGLRLSSHEVLLVTTEIKSENMGLPDPLRLKVIPKPGQNVCIENLVETTIKLTLLHHGSLKEPRLPIPLFGSDRIAYRRLKGISLGGTVGDRQFWL
jgi:Piwi domain